MWTMNTHTPLRNSRSVPAFLLLVGDLIQFINSKLYRSDHAPLFLYVQNELVVSRESSMAELYQEYREDDFFLYLAYYEENTHRDIPVVRTAVGLASAGGQP